MRIDRIFVVGALGLGGLIASGRPSLAQERTIVSNEISVSSRDASIRLEFRDGGDMELGLAEGAVVLNGEQIATYPVGGAVESAWRSLLGSVVSLSNGPLGQALVEWSPEATGEEDVAVLETLDATLEEQLGGGPRAAAPEPMAEGLDLGRLTSVLLRAERLEGLSEALDEVSLSDVRLRLGEDVRIESGERLDDDLVVIGGDVDVYGEVAGDIVVVDGTLTLHEGGSVEGDVRLVDARMERSGGSVSGSVVDVARASRDRERELRDRIRAEVEREVERSISHEAPSRGFNPFRHIGRGLAGLFSNLVTFGMIGLLALLVLRLAGDRLDLVARAVEENPARTGLVGLAGMVLVVPAFVLGLLLLIVSIVGLPAVLVWIPVFPIAVALAAGVGYLAVARNAGRWVARQKFQGLEWLDTTTETGLVLAGVGALMLPFVAANVFRMGGPLFGIFYGLLGALGSLLLFVAMAVGFGGVLITRGGTRPVDGFPLDDLDLEDDEAWDLDLEAEVEAARQAADEELETIVAEEAVTPEPGEEAASGGDSEPAGSDGAGEAGVKDASPDEEDEARG